MKWLVGLAMVVSTPAWAQDIKPLCPDRGAFQTCTIDPHHIQVESSLVDWSDDAESTTLLADMVVRVGLDQETEIQFALSPWVKKDGRVGQSDIRIAVRHTLLDQRLSVAVQPMISLPTGSEMLTQGQVKAGAALAVMYDLSPRTQFYFTPAVLPTRDPTQVVFLGVNQAFTRTVGGTLEFQAQHSPGVHQASVNLTSTWTTNRSMEFDINANIGVTADTPAVQLILGVTRRF